MKMEMETRILRTNFFIFLAALICVPDIKGFIAGPPVYEPDTGGPPDVLESPPPSSSCLRFFKRAAICTDSTICSAIGKDILSRNGSAVDSVIAAQICNGIVNPHAVGIGGGFTMTVFIKEEQRSYTVVARETAPSAATRDMFKGRYEESVLGPLSSAIPGEVRGLWEAHKRWGRLPWESLFTPALDLCRTGFPLGHMTHKAISETTYIKDDINMREQFYDSENEVFKKEGDIIKPLYKYCNTLRKIAKNGGDDLYTGALSVEFLEDLKEAGSIITAADLKSYQPKIENSVKFPLGNTGDILLAPAPPSSGVILVNILNILSGYNFTAANIKTFDDETLTYHRIVEAFKYSYSLRSKLGDPDYLDLNELMKNVTSQEYGEYIRSQINDDTTSNSTATYGANEYTIFDAGTSHISIISQDGDAVSLTSSINNYFGAGYSTQNTGIIMNDVMDDFSSPGITNLYGINPSPANFIEPGKRPLSSMSPTIILDKKHNVKMVVGGSGGGKITTAIALVILRNLWFGETLKEAIDSPRVHHQIFPTMNTEYEYGVTQHVINGLRNKGHGIVRYKDSSCICAIARDPSGVGLYANADYRRGGDTDGVN